MLLPRDNNNSIELKDKTATWLFGIHHDSESTKNRVIVVGGVMDSDYEGKLDCYSVREVRKSLSETQEIPCSVS